MHIITSNHKSVDRKKTDLALAAEFESAIKVLFTKKHSRVPLCVCLYQRFKKEIQDEECSISNILTYNSRHFRFPPWGQIWG